MRYIIFLPESKGGYKVGEENELVAALCLQQDLNQKYHTVCIVYDSVMKTTDVSAMMNDKVKGDYGFGYRSR